jgi:hypothetical protein
MDPTTQAVQKPGLPLMRDVTPPKAQTPITPFPTKTKPESSPPAAASVKMEIVSDIPVKNPIGGMSNIKPGPIINPMKVTARPPTPAVGDGEDKELDQILKDVNSSVKQTENSLEARFEHLSGVRKKVAVKKAKLNESHNDSPPIAATLIACVVGVALAALAVLILK